MARKGASLSKRVARLEARGRPEMKSISWNITGNLATATLNTLECTSIAQGIADNERIGDKVRVWRMEVRGHSDSNQLDHYILQKHGTSSPVYADWTGGKFAFLDSFREGEFTEWLSWKGFNVNTTEGYAFRKSIRFPRGMVVHYSGDSSIPVRNGLLVCTRNTAGVTLGVSYVVRVWFTDN